jgi:hypothetical protein
MTKDELRAIAARLDRGCPTAGVTLSPWAIQLQKDARTLLLEVESLQKKLARS